MRVLLIVLGLVPTACATAVPEVAEETPNKTTEVCIRLDALPGVNCTAWILPLQFPVTVTMSLNLADQGAVERYAPNIAVVSHQVEAT